MVGAPEDQASKLLDVDVVDALGVRQVLGHELRHRHLVDAQVGVRRDDGAAGEVDSFPRKVASEAALLSLQALAEAPRGLTIAGLGQAGNVAVDVHGDLQLQELPLLHYVSNGGALGQTAADEAADLDDLRQLGGKVVFRAGAVLGHRRTDADGRRRQVLPDEHLGPALGRIQAEKFAIGRANFLKEVQHPQGVQVLESLAQVLLQVRDTLLRRCEGPVELLLAFRRLLLEGRGPVEGGVAVVDELQGAQPLDRAVLASAARTLLCLPAQLVDLLANLRPSHVVDPCFPQLFQKPPAIRLHQQHATTVLES